MSLAVAAGAGTAIAVSAEPATAFVPALSLDAQAGEVALTIVNTAPSTVLRRYANVFNSVPDSTAVFYRNSAGALKLAAGCHGLSAQVQIFDVGTGKLELSATPFPLGGGGAGNVSYVPATNSLLAFGSSIKKITLSGAVTTAYAAAPGTTNVSFARAVDAKKRVWCGNYPTGSATRFDPATGYTAHTPRVHPDAQYVRSLDIDANDNVYAGTGAQNPRIVTWHADSPTKLREIPIPGAASVGFVYNITAHSGWLFVYFDQDDGAVAFRAYDIAAAAWKVLPWPWAPAGRVSGAYDANGDIFAVWNTVGTHKLMKINPRTMAAELVCLVPDTPSVLKAEVIDGIPTVHMLCGAGQSQTYVRVSVPAKAIAQTVPVTFAASPYQVQTLMATAAGTVLYVGAFMGDGIASVELDSRATWRSATDTGIAQIEGMFQYNDSSIYVGSYGGGHILKFNPQTKATKELISLGDKYRQSRPVAWASAGGRVVAGTIAEYGYNTGALVSINPAVDSDTTVVSGPVPGQSVLGLVGEGDIVYGTTGIKGGYGSVDDTKPAHVFAWNARTAKLLWKRPLTGEIEINTPILIKGILYVSTNNGVVRLNKASGSTVFTYRLLSRSAPAGYRTSSISYLPSANSIVHECGGTVTILNTMALTRKEILRGNYSNMVVSSRGRLYFAENGTNIVEVDTVQKPSITSAADLVTVGIDGWLYVTRSLGGGKYAAPLRTDSGFGTYVRSCHVVDWNGDGLFDVITNHGDGTLQLHKGLPAGGFAPGTVVGTSGWLDRKLAIGVWGQGLTVVASENVSGALQAWPVLSTGMLGAPVAIGSGWKRKQMVMLVPSRSTAAALIVNEAGSLYRYSRLSTGKVSTVPARLSTGGFTDLVVMTGVRGHKPDLNGIVGVDAAGAVMYADVAVGSVGAPTKYPFLMKNYRFASS